MPKANYHGSKGQVRMAISGGSKAIVASITQWTLDKKVDYVETTAMGDTNKTYVPGLPDISGTLTANFDSSDTTLLSVAESSIGGDIALYPSTNIPGFYHYGPIWLDVSYSTSVSGVVGMTANYKANGSWAHQGF